MATTPPTRKPGSAPAPKQTPKTAPNPNDAPASKKPVPAAGSTKPNAVKGRKKSAFGKKVSRKPKATVKHGTPTAFTGNISPQGKSKKKDPSVVEEKPPPKEVKLTRHDLYVIVTIWCCGITFAYYEGWKLSFFGKHQYYTAKAEKIERANFHGPTSIEKIIALIVTLIAMAGVAIVAYRKPKFIYLIIGLSVFVPTPFFGLLAAIYEVHAFTVVMLFLEVGWNSVNPLRYWLIFYQKFPLPAVQSRIIVTGCELVVDSVEYITTVWVSWRKFNSLSYGIAWVFLFALFLIFFLLFLYIKRYVHSSAELPMDVVRREYEETQLMESLLYRETTQHLILFSCILVPSAMFSVQKATVHFVFEYLRGELPKVAFYRIDLILTLLLLPVVSAILCRIHLVRSEMFDPIVIAIAHVSNVLVVAFILTQIIIHSNDNVRTVSLQLRQENDDKSYLEIPRTGSLQYILRSQTELILKLNDKQADETQEGYAFIFLPKGTLYKISLFEVDGTRVFEDEVTAKDHEARYYKNGKLTMVKDFFATYLPAVNVERRTLRIATDFDPCEDGVRQNDMGTRAIFEGKCQSIQVELSFKDRDKLLEDPVKRNIPLLGEPPEYGVITVPEETTSVAVRVLVDGNQKPSIDTELLGSANSYAYHFLFVYVSKKGDSEKLKVDTLSLKKFIYIDIPLEPFPGSLPVEEDKKHWSKNKKHSLVSALCAASAAIGVGSVSYIHFIWIQCPWERRTIILAFFFGINYLGFWLPEALLTRLGALEFSVLLIFQVAGCVWHAISSFIYWKRLRKLTDDEKKPGNRLKF